MKSAVARRLNVYDALLDFMTAVLAQMDAAASLGGRQTFTFVPRTRPPFRAARSFKENNREELKRRT